MARTMFHTSNGEKLHCKQWIPLDWHVVGEINSRFCALNELILQKHQYPSDISTGVQKTKWSIDCSRWPDDSQDIIHHQKKAVKIPNFFLGGNWKSIVLYSLHCKHTHTYMLLKIAVRTHFMWRANSPILHKHCERIVLCKSSMYWCEWKNEAYVLLNKQKKICFWIDGRARAHTEWMCYTLTPLQRR